MKKVLCILLSSVLVLCLVACGGGGASNAGSSGSTGGDSGSASTGGGAAPSGDVVTLKLAHGIPQQAMTGQQYNAFCEFVEELSDGSIVVEQHVGGTLVSDTETLDAVMDGTVDFIHSMSSYVSGTITDIAPLEVYGYYNSDDWLGFIESIEPTLEKIYEPYGIKYLGSLYQGTSVIVCTDKQITSPDDMKGMSFRASGTWIGKSIEAWGAAPTTIALADLTTAFERNTVQGTATGWNIAVPFALYETADYFTFTNIQEAYAALLMNMDTWNSLTAEQQAIIEEAADMFMVESEKIALGLREDYQKTVEDYGTNTYTLTPEEEEKFVELSLGLYDEVESKVGEDGKELIRLIEAQKG